MGVFRVLCILRLLQNCVESAAEFSVFLLLSGVYYVYGYYPFKKRKEKSFSKYYFSIRGAVAVGHIFDYSLLHNFHIEMHTFNIQQREKQKLKAYL